MADYTDPFAVPYDELQNKPIKPKLVDPAAFAQANSFVSPDPRGQLSSVGKGLRSWVDDMQAAGGGFVGQLGQAATNIAPAVVKPYTEAVRDWGIKTYERNTAESVAGSQAPTAAESDLTNATSIGEVGDFAAYQLAKNLGTTATTLASAYLTGGLAAGAVGAGLKQTAAKAIGALASKQALSTGIKTALKTPAAKQQIASAFTKGGVVGAAVPMFGIEGGSSFGGLTTGPDAVSPEKALMPSLAVGAVNAAIEGLEFGIVAKALGISSDVVRKSVMQKIKDAPDLSKKAIELGKSIAKGAALGVPVEGGQEAVQELVSIAGDRWAKDEKLFDKLNPEEQKRIQSAAITGGLVGGVAGGALGPLQGGKEPPTTPIPPAAAQQQIQGAAQFGAAVQTAFDRAHAQAQATQQAAAQQAAASANSAAAATQTAKQTIAQATSPQAGGINVVPTGGGVSPTQAGPAGGVPSSAVVGTGEVVGAATAGGTPAVQPGTGAAAAVVEPAKQSVGEQTVLPNATVAPSNTESSIPTSVPTPTPPPAPESILLGGYKHNIPFASEKVAEVAAKSLGLTETHTPVVVSTDNEGKPSGWGLAPIAPEVQPETQPAPVVPGAQPTTEEILNGQVHNQETVEQQVEPVQVEPAQTDAAPSANPETGAAPTEQATDATNAQGQINLPEGFSLQETKNADGTSQVAVKYLSQGMDEDGNLDDGYDFTVAEGSTIKEALKAANAELAKDTFATSLIPEKAKANFAGLFAEDEGLLETNLPPNFKVYTGTEEAPGVFVDYIVNTPNGTDAYPIGQGKTLEEAIAAAKDNVKNISFYSDVMEADAIKELYDYKTAPAVPENDPLVDVMAGPKVPTTKQPVHEPNSVFADGNVFKIADANGVPLEGEFENETFATGIADAHTAYSNGLITKDELESVLQLADEGYTWYADSKEKETLLNKKGDALGYVTAAGPSNYGVTQIETDQAGNTWYTAIGSYGSPTEAMAKLEELALPKTAQAQSETAPAMLSDAELLKKSPYLLNKGLSAQEVKAAFDNLKQPITQNYATAISYLIAAEGDATKAYNKAVKEYAPSNSITALHNWIQINAADKGLEFIEAGLLTHAGIDSTDNAAILQAVKQNMPVAQPTAAVPTLEELTGKLYGDPIKPTVTESYSATPYSVVSTNDGFQFMDEFGDFSSAETFPTPEAAYKAGIAAQIYDNADWMESDAAAAEYAAVIAPLQKGYDWKFNKGAKNQSDSWSLLDSNGIEAAAIFQNSPTEYGIVSATSEFKAATTLAEAQSVAFDMAENDAAATKPQQTKHEDYIMSSILDSYTITELEETLNKYSPGVAAATTQVLLHDGNIAQALSDAYDVGVGADAIQVLNEWHNDPNASSLKDAKDILQQALIEKSPFILAAPNVGEISKTDVQDLLDKGGLIVDGHTANAVRALILSKGDMTLAGYIADSHGMSSISKQLLTQWADPNEDQTKLTTIKEKLLEGLGFDYTDAASIMDALVNKKEKKTAYAASIENEVKLATAPFVLPSKMTWAGDIEKFLANIGYPSSVSAAQAVKAVIAADGDLQKAKADILSNNWYSILAKELVTQWANSNGENAGLKKLKDKILAYYGLSYDDPVDILNALAQKKATGVSPLGVAVTSAAPATAAPATAQTTAQTASTTQTTVKEISDAWDKKEITEKEALAKLIKNIRESVKNTLLKLSHMFQLGGKPGGWSKGGIFLDKDTKRRLYIKEANSHEQALSEILASELYQAAGVYVPEYKTIDLNSGVIGTTEYYGSQTGLASRMVPGIRKDPAALASGNIKGVFENFVIDAWLANYDVIGANEGLYGNMQVVGDKAIRLDFGGALQYRATGGIKTTWGNDVGELTSMRNPKINKEAAEIFKGVTDAHLKQGAEILARIPDAKIEWIVKNRITSGADALAKTLIARKKDILAKLGVADNPIKWSAEQQELENEFLLAARNPAEFGLDSLLKITKTFSDKFGYDAVEEMLNRVSQYVVKEKAPSLTQWTDKPSLEADLLADADPHKTIWAEWAQQWAPDPYDPTVTSIHRYGVIVINPQTNKVLLRRVKNPNGDVTGGYPVNAPYIWSFGGGGVKQGLHPLEGAKKETKEEFGIDTTVIGAIPKAFGKGKSSSAPLRFYYVGVQKGEQGTFDKETDRTVWVTYAEAKELLKLTQDKEGAKREVRTLDAVFSMGEHKNGFHYKGNAKALRLYYEGDFATDFPKLVTPSITGVLGNLKPLELLTPLQRLRIAVAHQTKMANPKLKGIALQKLAKDVFDQRKAAFAAQGVDLSKIVLGTADIKFFKQGQPITIMAYHGSQYKEGVHGDMFLPGPHQTSGGGGGDTKYGFFAAETEEQAKSWGSQLVYPLLLNFKNPKVVNPLHGYSSGYITDMIKLAKEQGHDGLIMYKLDDAHGKNTQFIFWDPSTVLSNEMEKVNFEGNTLYANRPNKPSEPITIDEAKAVLGNVFGVSQLKTAQAKGFVVLHEEEAPDNVAGKFENGVLHLYLENIAPTEIVGYALHEGVHSKLQDILGASLPAYYKELLELADTKNEIAVSAIEMTALVGAERFGFVTRFNEETNPEARADEVARIRALLPEEFKVQEDLAHYTQAAAFSNTSVGLYRRIISAIKAWFAQSNLGKWFKQHGMGVSLDDGMAVALATMAVKRQMAEGSTSNAEYYARVWNLARQQWKKEAGFPNGRFNLEKAFAFMQQQIKDKGKVNLTYAFGAYLGSLENHADKDKYLNKFLKHNSTVYDYSMNLEEGVLPRTLLWDKSILAQPQFVQDAIASSADGFYLLKMALRAQAIEAPYPYPHKAPSKTTGLGGSFMRALWEDKLGKTYYQTHWQDPLASKQELEAKKAVSEFLSSVGVVGLRYLREMDQAKGKGKYNYVIWDQKVLDNTALISVDTIKKTGFGWTVDSHKMVGNPDDYLALTTGMEGTVYSSASGTTRLSRDEFNAQVAAKFGQGWLDKAVAAGAVVVNEVSEEGAPAGTFNPETGVTTVNLDRLPNDEAPLAVLLHEGGHSLENMLGTSFVKYADDVRAAADGGNRSAQQAFVKAVLEVANRFGVRHNLKSTMSPESLMREASRVSQILGQDQTQLQHLRQEQLGYFIQYAKEGGLFRRIINAIKAWWASSQLGKAFAQRGLRFRLTDEMATALAVRALREHVGPATSKALGGQLQYESFVGENARLGLLPQMGLKWAKARLQTHGNTQANRERIWAVTGWIYGPDLKWRYELSDKQAVVNEEAVKALPEVNTDEAIDKGEEPTNAAKLQDVLDHPRLFSSYPALRSVAVVHDKTFKGGFYLPGWNLITIGTRLNGDEYTGADLKNLVLHEAQHATQTLAGLFDGTAIESIEQSKTYKNYLDFVIKRDGEVTPEESDAILHAMYRHGSVGEVEAWDVGSRMDLSAAERKQTSPDLIKRDWSRYLFRSSSAADWVKAAFNARFADEADDVGQAGFAHKLELWYKEMFADLWKKDPAAAAKFNLSRSIRNSALVDFKQEVLKPFEHLMTRLAKDMNMSLEDISDSFAAWHIVNDKANLKMALANGNSYSIMLENLMVQQAKKMEKGSAERKQLSALMREQRMGRTSLLRGKTWEGLDPVAEDKISPHVMTQDEVQWTLFKKMEEAFDGKVGDTNVWKLSNELNELRMDWEFLKLHAMGFATPENLSTNPEVREQVEAVLKATGARARNAHEIYNKVKDNVLFQQAALVMQDVAAKARATLVRGGLISQDEANAMGGKWQHWAPMRRDSYDFDSALKTAFNKATGRPKVRAGTSTVDPPVHVMQNMFANYDTAVTAAESNIARAFLADAIEADPNEWVDWASVSEDGPFIKSRSKYGFITARKTSGGKYDIPFYREGMRYLIRIRENNERAVMLSDAIQHLSSQELGPVARTMQQMNNWIRFINISASPAFMLMNAPRDFGTAMLNLKGTKLADFTGEVAKEYMTSLKELAGHFLSKDPSKRSARVLAWERSGGRMSFVESLKPNDQGFMSMEASIKHSMGKFGRVNLGSFAGRATVALREGLEKIESLNILMENVVRFSTWKVAMVHGLSADEAALLSKDVTTNYDRKGLRSQALGAYYLFFNASLQGSAQVLRNIMSGPNRAKMLKAIGAVAVLALMNDLLGAMLNDDWDDVPEEQKDRFARIAGSNLVWPDGKGMVKIPLPWVFNTIWRMGEMTGEVIRGKLAPTSMAAKTTMLMVNSMNPVGGSLGQTTPLQFVAPTALDWFVQIQENRDPWGNLLGPDKMPGEEYKPDSQMVWINTPDRFKHIAEMVNEWTGGSIGEQGLIDWRPSTYKVLEDTLIGGGGRFITGLLESAWGAGIEGKPVSVNRVPGLKTFTYVPEGAVGRSLYHDRVAKIEQASKAEKTFLSGEHRNLQELQRVRHEQGALLRMKPVADDVERQLQGLRKAMRLARMRGQDARVEMLDARIKMLQDRFNTTYSRRVG